MKRSAIDKIAQELSSRLHELVEQRIMRDRIIDWQKAYAHRGPVSTRPRRRDIEFIYSEAAPIPGGIANPPSNEFLREIRMLIRDSIQHAGGRLEGLPDHNEAGGIGSSGVGTFLSRRCLDTGSGGLPAVPSAPAWIRCSIRCPDTDRSWQRPGQAPHNVGDDDHPSLRYPRTP